MARWLRVRKDRSIHKRGQLSAATELTAQIVLTQLQETGVFEDKELHVPFFYPGMGFANGISIIGARFHKGLNLSEATCEDHLTLEHSIFEDALDLSGSDIVGGISLLDAAIFGDLNLYNVHASGGFQIHALIVQETFDLRGFHFKGPVNGSFARPPEKVIIYPDQETFWRETFPNLNYEIVEKES